MIIMWEIILEVLKYTIPALVVFLSVYFILKQYLASQYELKALELRNKYSKNAIPLKLQAYERLLLFCERISIPNLIMRLKTRNMTAEALQNAMMISVQKEYEHNMAQQLYASQQLWDIISLAKNDILSIINNQSSKVSSQESANVLTDSLFAQLKQMKSSPLDLAIQAIKEETKIILDV